MENALGGHELVAQMADFGGRARLFPLPNLVFMSDYSFFLPQGGMAPNAVNGFVIGIKVTDTVSAVPEPSSMSLAALGAALMGGVGLWRLRARPWSR